MIRARHILPILLGACILGAMMATTPGFDRAFRPLRTTAPSGDLAQGRLHAARFAGWQTADNIAFDVYGAPVTRSTQGIFLIVDVDILNASESIRLAATWQGRSGRRYVQTARADGAPGTFDVRQFHPGIDDKGRAVFELPKDEIEGGTLLLARKGLNILDSELALISPQGMPAQHTTQLRLAP